MDYNRWGKQTLAIRLTLTCVQRYHRFGGQYGISVRRQYPPDFHLGGTLGLRLL